MNLKEVDNKLKEITKIYCDNLPTFNDENQMTNLISRMSYAGRDAKYDSEISNVASKYDIKSNRDRDDVFYLVRRYKAIYMYGENFRSEDELYDSLIQ